VEYDVWDGERNRRRERKLVVLFSPPQTKVEKREKEKTGLSHLILKAYVGVDV
jgi:hypothetical protein